MDEMCDKQGVQDESSRRKFQEGKIMNKRRKSGREFDMCYGGGDIKSTCLMAWPEEWGIDSWIVRG